MILSALRNADLSKYKDTMRPLIEKDIFETERILTDFQLSGLTRDIKTSIADTKTGFENSFATENFYDKQTQDETHLKRILECLRVSDGMKILDLGTGTGYLAFPFATQYPKAQVTGLDIVELALNRNRERATQKELKNLRFVNYNGLIFPFESKTFDMVITRYALHHFPDIEGTFREVCRVLKPGGKFFLSDPAPNDDDMQRFVDAYMQMKKDGHIKFYTKKEWQRIGESTGFKFVDDFETDIRFPKKRQNALELDSILQRFDEQVVKGYDLEIVDNEIWITEKVNNILLQKSPSDY